MQLKIFDTFDDNHPELYQDILNLTGSARQFYPGYEDWFYKTFIPGIKKKERLIITAQNETGALIGCALIKNTPSEKKICTLYVKPKYRRQGIGTTLIRQAIQIVGEYPLITVSQENINQLLPFLTRQGFRLSTAKRSLYRTDSIEYLFNDKQTEVIQKRLIPVLVHRAHQLERY